MVCDTKMFWCNRCQASCDDTYYLGQYKAKDTYMGRNEPRTTVMTYYCSNTCFEPMYIEYTTENITNHIIYLKEVIDLLSRHNCIAYPRPRNENPFPMLLAYRVYLRFLEACLTHTVDMNPLYKLRHDAKTKLGDALEEYHTSDKLMNIICFMLSSIDSVMIRLFAKK